MSVWFPNTHAAFEPLSAFEGETGNGNWTLTLVDGFDDDTGTLDEWGLELVCQ